MYYNDLSCIEIAICIEKYIYKKALIFLLSAFYLVLISKSQIQLRMVNFASTAFY